MGRVLLLTDRSQAREPLPTVIRQAVLGGIRTVVLRERDLPWSLRSELVLALRRVLGPVGGVLLLAGPVDSRFPDKAKNALDGCHLAGRDRWPGTDPQLIGRSCHTPQDLADAAQAGARYATLSPVFPSTSKPGYGPALGTSVLRGPWPLPVYALGGVETPLAAKACIDAGAAGVAVMGTVMRAAHPRDVAAALVKAVAA